MTECWLSPDEIAAHLGVNSDTICNRIDRKSMPAHKLGRLWKFLASEVDGWIKGGWAGDTVKESHAPEAKQPGKRSSNQNPTK